MPAIREEPSGHRRETRRIKTGMILRNLNHEVCIIRAVSGDVTFRSLLVKGGGWLLVAMIVCGAFDAAYLRIFVTDRDALRAQFTAYPDVAFPTLPSFLQKVRETTEPESA